MKKIRRVQRFIYAVAALRRRRRRRCLTRYYSLSRHTHFHYQDRADKRVWARTHAPLKMLLGGGGGRGGLFHSSVCGACAERRGDKRASLRSFSLFSPHRQMMVWEEGRKGKQKKEAKFKDGCGAKKESELIRTPTKTTTTTSMMTCGRWVIICGQ